MLDNRSYSARVLADSLSPDDVRLTTLEVTFPRFILAEINTHRMLSRNSASSRAIPTEKLIDRVRNAPFIPETFNKRVKGMSVGRALFDDEATQARIHWIAASEEAARYAERLMSLDVDKSRANRLLEPFLWHTAIISATEWDNFFALRDHPAAQPEMQIIARMMREVIEMSHPNLLDYGEWHLPLVYESDRRVLEIEALKMVSASRCARVSFDKHTDDEPLAATIDRAQRLRESGHFSPFEHVARPVDDHGAAGGVPDYGMWNVEWTDFVGNFRGWVQMRKEIPHEDNFARLINSDDEVSA